VSYFSGVTGREDVATSRAINVNMREMWPEFADVKKLGEKVECLEGRCSIQLSYGRTRLTRTAVGQG
jgi:hypothetical protein